MFLDFSKAFDRVNYWKLFSQMLEEGSDVCVVRLLAYWYSNQTLLVAWQGCYSGRFMIGNGTRQGGVLSPSLFTHFSLDFTTLQNFRKFLQNLFRN